jgi:hypothetical protein
MDLGVDLVKQRPQRRVVLNLYALATVKALQRLLNLPPQLREAGILVAHHPHCLEDQLLCVGILPSGHRLMYVLLKVGRECQ